MSAAKLLHENKPVYACVVRERETNVQVWSADVDDHSATNTGTRSQTQVLTARPASVRTTKHTRVRKETNKVNGGYLEVG